MKDKSLRLTALRLRTTDIQLEPGETITDVASGDSERWLVTPASSGDPRNPTPHLAIKPTAAGISTNLTIYTTKHIYHLMLRSRAGHEIQEVAFYYPEDLEQAMQNADHTAAKAREPAIAAGRSGRFSGFARSGRAQFFVRGFWTKAAVEADPSIR